MLSKLIVCFTNTAQLLSFSAGCEEWKRESSTSFSATLLLQPREPTVDTRVANGMS